MRLVALPQAVNHNILLLIKYLLQFTQLTMTLLAYRRLFETLRDAESSIHTYEFVIFY